MPRQLGSLVTTAALRAAPVISGHFDPGAERLMISPAGPRDLPCGAGTGSSTVYLPVLAARALSYEQQHRTTSKALTLLGRLALRASLRFTVAAGGGNPVSAWWELTGDQASIDDAVTALRFVTTTYLTWADLGSVSLTPPLALGPVSHHLLRSLASSTGLYSARACGWDALSSDPSLWGLTLDLVSLPAGEPPATPIVASDKSSSDGRGSLCRILVHGSGARRDLAASLLAEDSIGSVVLAADPVRGTLQHPATEFPHDLVAHLLAIPGRLPGRFPSHPPTDPTELLAAFTGAASPHVLILGGTGQGKTTLLAHLADVASSAGGVLACVDVHDGDLTTLLAERTGARGQQPVIARFHPGSEDPRPAAQLNLLHAPPGMAPELWADDVYDIVRGVLWADVPADYFGPVGERALRACLQILAADPAGARPLSDLPLLLDPHDAGYRTALLARTSEVSLRRTLINEVMPMLTSRDPGNSLVWLLAKLEPLIGNHAVTACSTAGADTVGVEDAVAAGRPFFLHAPAAALGDAGSRVLVAVVLHRLWLAIRRRPSATPPVHLILDEWQRYPTPTLATVVTEGRKWGLRLLLANQNLAQLPVGVRDTVLANTGTIGCFRTGPADAALLDQRYPTVTTQQLQQLPTHHLAVTTGAMDFVAATPPPLAHSEDVGALSPRG